MKPSDSSAAASAAQRNATPTQTRLKRRPTCPSAHRHRTASCSGCTARGARRALKQLTIRFTTNLACQCVRNYTRSGRRGPGRASGQPIHVSLERSIGLFARAIGVGNCFCWVSPQEPRAFGMPFAGRSAVASASDSASDRASSLQNALAENFGVRAGSSAASKAGCDQSAPASGILVSAFCSIALFGTLADEPA